MADCAQWMTHAYGECSDCGQTFESKNAQGLAAQHADKYGHTVEVDIGYHYQAKPSGGP